MISSNERGQSTLPDVGALMLQTPAEAGYPLPAEWEGHACCWMCWPSRAEQWADGLAGAQSTYAAIARAIRRFEPVRMVAEPHSVADARAQCGLGVEVLPMPIDDPWMRDSGPTFVRRSDGALAGTAWRYESDRSATGAALRLAADNRRALELAVDTAGHRLQIISIDDAYEVQTPHRLFCRSYVNFYIANGGIVMPGFGVPGDERARAVIQAAFPDREVAQVDVTRLACGGGGIHCITQQQPA